MAKSYVSSTDLKNKTSEILNLVAYGGKVIGVTRYGEPLVEIRPVRVFEEKARIKRKLKKYFGVIPSFPRLNRGKRSRRISF